jgi:hypothetical protein
MAKATSTPESSPSSALANALLSSIGFTSAFSDSAVKPSIRSRVARSFTSKIRREASSPDLWGSSAQSLNVTIGADDRVTVGVEGTEEELRMAEALEYGTPDSPPRGVMRVYENDFNEEYKVAMEGYDL